MTKRGLIIGSQTGGLRGVHNDTATMQGLLEERGFTTEVLIEQAARRDGIIEGYRRLIRDSQPQDAAVVYYSGHGGYAPNPHYGGQGTQPRAYQFIVPTDMDQTTESDFRGILGVELSELQAELTEKTKNVSVILDCCHAACMSRAVDLVPKALPRPWFAGVAAHLERLLQEGLTVSHVESNPHAVRVVATEQDKPAFEHTNMHGTRIGIFTEALAAVLAEAKGRGVSWNVVGGRVRETVLAMVPGQRPEIEGPRDRMLFSLEEANLHGVVNYFDDVGSDSLRAGRLFNVQVGDRYGIMPLDAQRFDERSEVARAIVTEVQGHLSRVDLDYRNDNTTVEDGAPAFPVEVSFPEQAVSVGSDLPAELVEQIESSRFVGVAEDGGSAELGTIVMENDAVVHRMQDGTQVLPPVFTAEPALARLVANLEVLARAQVFQNLEAGGLERPIECEWGLVLEGKTQQLDAAGDSVYAGDYVYFRIENTESFPLYIGVFDIGVDGAITLLSNPGTKVKPGEWFTLGETASGMIEGLGPTSWPDTIVKNGPLSESVVIIASDSPQDFMAFQSRGVRRAAERALRSQLEQYLEQVGQGATRNIPAGEPEQQEGRYGVVHIDFLMHPDPRPVSGRRAHFIIDESRAPSELLALPKVVSKPPEKVAIRVRELVVHKNRAFGKAKVRVDTLVVTGKSAQGQELYRVESMYFPQIRDGERLPFDNAIVFDGPVADFVDFAVWISRHSDGKPSLADMLRDALNSDEFKQAATAIGTLAVAGPQVALGVGALAAASTIGAIAYDLISEAVGKSIGLYRTSFLPHEQLGVGKHPANGLRRAQDFSFAFEVIEVP